MIISPDIKNAQGLQIVSQGHIVPQVELAIPSDMSVDNRGGGSTTEVVTQVADPDYANYISMTAAEAKRVYDHFVS